MSNTIDRLTGLGGDAAVKAPCRVATSANITLSGLQTIDGETLVAYDRVLVKNQNTTSENGIWVASSTAWSRAADFNGSRDVVNGTLVLVAEGSDPGRLYKADVTDPVVIGTDAIAFSYVEVAAAIAPASVDTTELADSAVETAKINNLAVTTAKLAADAVDGTKLADDAVNTEHLNDAVFSGLTLVTPTSLDHFVLADQSDSDKPKKALISALATLLSNKLIATYSANYTTNGDLTTALPVDDTAPVITEGTQILSLAATTTSATQVNDIKIEGSIAWTASTAMAMTVWRGSTCVKYAPLQPAGGAAAAGYMPFAVIFRDEPASAAAHTYTVRVGANAGGAGSCRMNGTVSGRLGGGFAKTTITIDVKEP